MRQQSSIPRGAVNAATRFKSATRATMSTVTSGTGRHLPLSFFGAKQFSYGVRAKIWGRAQTFRSAFVVKRYGGGVFKRTGKARFPIEQLWGPAVPVEMMRDEAFAAWQAQHPRILTESVAFDRIDAERCPVPWRRGWSEGTMRVGAGRSPIFNLR